MVGKTNLIYNLARENTGFLCVGTLKEIITKKCQGLQFDLWNEEKYKNIQQNMNGRLRTPCRYKLNTDFCLIKNESR